MLCCLTTSGAVELESVEVKVQISNETDVTKIEKLIPKQVSISQGLCDLARDPVTQPGTL